LVTKHRLIGYYRSYCYGYSNSNYYLYCNGNYYGRMYGY
jgi:hypothetical protein